MVTVLQVATLDSVKTKLEGDVRKPSYVLFSVHRVGNNRSCWPECFAISEQPDLFVGVPVHCGGVGSDGLKGPF